MAAVNGVAAGAGCSLALACDMRIAAESASFVEAFIHVGLVPDCGSTFFLPRLVGLARALEVAMTGRKIKSDEGPARTRQSGRSDAIFFGDDETCDAACDPFRLVRSE